MRLAIGATAGAALAAAAWTGVSLAQDDERMIAGASCGHAADNTNYAGNATDPATDRVFYLEWPCDLEEGEDVTFILNIHGAGSYSGWQHQYFPASDYVDSHRLVVATPTALTAEPIRRWTEEADDEHLHNIVNMVIDEFGAENIRAFWLAGHSQGGATSHRIVCDDFFGDKVDGLLSLAGGRIGMRPEEAACEFSHIFTTGDYDSAGRAGVPSVSPVADGFNCGDRVRTRMIEDTEPGKVYDGRTEGRPDRRGWGGEPAPGFSDVFEFPNCDGGRVVADVIRYGKGHTEGLEPLVTEALIDLVVSAEGGRIMNGVEG
jgi:hypothetical protein